MANTAELTKEERKKSKRTARKKAKAEKPKKPRDYARGSKKRKVKKLARGQSEREAASLSQSAHGSLTVEKALNEDLRSMPDSAPRRQLPLAPIIHGTRRNDSHFGQSAFLLQVDRQADLGIRSPRAAAAEDSRSLVADRPRHRRHHRLRHLRAHWNCCG